MVTERVALRYVERLTNKKRREIGLSATLVYVKATYVHDNTPLLDILAPAGRGIAQPLCVCPDWILGPSDGNKYDPTVYSNPT